jgi:hypothetical protein
MNNEKQPNPNPNDEIDLGVLFSKIKRGFNRLGNSLLRAFLRFYLYLKSNVFWLGGIIVFGSSIGLMLEYRQGELFEVNVLVKPSLDAKNYLYATIDDINTNIEAQDTAFLSSLGMDIRRMDGFEIKIVSLKADNIEKLEKELQFLNVLKESGLDEFTEQLTNSILQDRATQELLITFYFTDPEIGEEYAQKIVNFLNINPYYKKLEQVLISNAEARILRNEELIAQVDGLIENYTKMMVEQQPATSGSLVLENKEPLNVPSLFTLKNELIKDTEAKRVELENRNGPVLVLSVGKARMANIHVVYKKAVYIPAFLLAVFFAISLLKAINRKAQNMILN